MPKPAAVVALFLLVAPALAQGAEPSTQNYETKVGAIKPAVQGLEVTTGGGDRYLIVKNETGKPVSIPGYDDEPYLRFLPSGEVDANANSPAKYLNAIRFGTAETITIPKRALIGGKPDWQKVADHGSYRWFDHRIHWMEKQPPPVVTDKDKRTKVFDWKVPVSVGDQPVTVVGTLSWVPTTSSSSSGVPGGAIAAIVAGVLVLLAFAALLLRRRSRPATAEAGPREKPGKEAW